MILHPWYKFLVDRPNYPRDIADYRFWIWRPIAILSAKLRLFINWPVSEWKFTSAYQIWPKSNDWRLRYDDKTIFEVAAFLHFKYSKLLFWSRDLYLHAILHLLYKFRTNRPKLRQRRIFDFKPWESVRELISCLERMNLEYLYYQKKFFKQYDVFC